MKKQFSTGVAVLALALAGCGSDEQQPASGVEEQTADAVKGNGTDRAFVAAMIPHHESAVEMAEIAESRGESEFVKELADNITRTQTEEIDIMRAQDTELADAGVKPGKLGVSDHMMGMDEDPAMLKSADPFDAAFIKMMIPHHEGAVEMAKEELKKGADPELRQLAEAIVEAQQREIDEMIAHTKGSTDAGEHGSGHDG
jgi:uncharacterized protein (DUF305 family)